MHDKGIDFHRSGYSPTYHEIGRSTSIAVNLGGTVIPVLMSIFLSTLVSMVDVVIGILVMTVIVHKISKPIIGSGIAIHVVLPPLLAAAIALMISPQDAPLIAYISGTIGCLIGIAGIGFSEKSEKKLNQTYQNFHQGFFPGIPFCPPFKYFSGSPSNAFLHPGAQKKYVVPL